MDIGVPRETHRHEHRVAVTPLGARRLVEHGHRVFVESGAGEAARYGDKDYREAGAEVVYRKEEVAPPRRDGPRRRRSHHRTGRHVAAEGQCVFGFLHLAVAPRDTVRKLIERKVTAIGFEIVEDDEGTLPVLHSIGELAGQMVVHTAAHLLMTECGGRGMLLGAVPGVAPARVLILGAGTVGCTAAHTALNAGAQVTIIDSDMAKLHRVAEAFDEPRGGDAGRPGDGCPLRASMPTWSSARSWSRGDRPRWLVTRDMVGTNEAGQRRSSTSRSTRAGASRQAGRRRSATRPSSSTMWSTTASPT